MWCGADREQEASPLVALNDSGIEAKLSLEDPEAVRYGKIMGADPGGGQCGSAGSGSLTLSARVNGGEWHPLSLEGMQIGRKIWVELPLDPTDLIAGENVVTLSSTAAVGQSVNDSVMLYGTADEDGNLYCVRIKYYPQIPSGWQDMTVPSAWEGNFTLVPEQEAPVGLVPSLCLIHNDDKGQLH